LLALLVLLRFVVSRYISVLPGAFSAYRYAALQNSAPGVGPLASYFAGEAMHGDGADLFKANMYVVWVFFLFFAKGSSRLRCDRVTRTGGGSTRWEDRLKRINQSQG
jgi:hypothetical protein